MKYLYSFLIAWAIGLSAWAQSGVDYDPENPADPSAPPTPAQSYTLTMETAPRYSGSVNNSTVTAEAGTEVYCRAYERTGYTFKQWMVGDSLVSTNSSFYFVMPAENVVLTAYFDYAGYDPENPDDPFADGYVHKVALYATPSVGGYFNSASFTLTENEETNIYAYPREGYRFSSWKQNGKIVSTENPLTIKMGTKDLEYTATFVYDPESPGNPSPNNFNPVTGELIIDEFISGNLNSAIYSVLGDNDYSLVQSVTVVGKMDSYDFGFANNLYNCTLIDLARTTGYTEVPSWAFEYNTSLTKVILPASVGQINRNAFYGCENLSEIVCYALIPPTVNSNAFNNIPEGVVVRVPSSVLSQYSETDGWKDFTLLPLDEETCAIGVSLPADATDGRYKNMTLELNNISSGQVLKYLITDRVVYSFANLVRDTKYNLYVKNASGAVLGSILDIEVGEENVDVAFESLLQPKNVTLKVVTSDNADVTQQTTITWFDEDGKYLNQGSVLKGVLEGVNVNCRIALSKDLAMQYVMPKNTEYTVASSDNSLVVQLTPFSEVNLSGIVKDITTESPINNATVTVSQLLNGKYSKSVVVRTDNTGAFNATVYDAACDVVVAANDYVSKTFELDHLADSAILSDILLKGITGVRINAQFTFTESVVEGETSETQNGYDDYANISYSIYNKTAQKEITNFNVQTPYIVLLEEVEQDDVLSITASSRTGSFKDVVVLGVVDVTNRVSVTIPIVELGELQANYKQSNSSKIVGVLYNSKGELLKKSSYSDASISFSDLEDGSYTLVTMESSSFFNSILNLKDLTNAGLIEGTHFVKNDISVQSGKITTLTIDNVPEFDDSQFYYTGSNTQFTVNKQSVTVGNYVTLRAKVDFKKEYANGVSDVKLVFDLPESCSFVDNSVLTGNGTGSYSVSENRIVVDLANINDVVRFCVTPTDGGTCRPSAFAQFNVNGKEVLQPIGTASFEAELMKIIVPEITASTSVIVSGVATSNSQIKIYDNNILVGQTQSLANGLWSTKVELYKPYSWTCHSIFAEISSANGEVLMTETKDLIYDKNSVELLKIWMLYNGEEIVFDIKNRKNSTNSYTYLGHSNIVDYTFVAEFSNCDTTNVKDVKFLVLLTDGTTRRIDGFYSSLGKWVASTKFPDDTRVPINVAVDWFGLSTDSIENDGLIDEDVNFLASQNEQIADFWNKKENVTIINETDESFTFRYDDLNEFEWIVSQRDYVKTLALTDSIQFSYGNDGENWYAYYLSSDDDSLVVTLIDYADNSALDIVVRNMKVSNIETFSRRLDAANVATGLVSGIAGTLWDLAGIKEFIDAKGDGQVLVDFLNKTSAEHSQKMQEINKLLIVKCKNGESRLTPTIESLFRLDLALTIKHQNDYLETLDKYIHEYEKRLLWNAGLTVATWGVGNAVKKAIKGGQLVGNMAKGLLNKMGFDKSWWAIDAQSKAKSVVGNCSDIAYDIVEETGSNMFQPDFTDFTEQKNKIWNWAPKTSNSIMEEYADLMKRIKEAYRSCPEDEDDEDDGDEDDDDFPNPPVTPAIDPSGFVYEGVSTNRLEGVMASCYYKETVEDMYGDLHENIVLWDAEQYAQENPLFTDENGMYRWDVPQGLWQVKFEKEGYQTTYSEWLPVPPPQLEVNIAMTQNKQPEVVSARAYEDGIEVEFSKYMQPDLLNTENIFVTKNGETAAGSVKLLNEEQSYEGKAETYASKVRFVPETSFLTTDEVTLTVSRKVKSYAGIQMGEDYTQSFDIEKEVKSLVADSVIKVPYGGTRQMTISALPYDAAIGKTLVVKSSSSMIATVNVDTLVMDENGQATVTLAGELPGTSVVTFALADADVNGMSTVQVAILEEKVTANPMASRVSGTAVYRGTEVTLSSETEGAVIYYTLDGSCPCDEATQIEYKAPIVITEDSVVIKAMAVAEDMYESDVVEFRYTLKKTTLGLSLKEGWNWVSHNVETPVAATELEKNAVRIVSQTEELVKDPTYGLIGNLDSISPVEAYKVQVSENTEHTLTGYEYNAAAPVAISAGWNWIGYPVNQVMSVDEAFANAAPAEGDYIVGQDGLAQYAGGKWTGTLLTLTPGKGYQYYAKSAYEFGYNTAIVSKAKALYGRGVANATPWTADKHKYPNVMSIIAELYTGNEVADGFAVGAFCGTECRGVGKYVDGRLMMTVYGNGGETIDFVAMSDGSEETFTVVETVTFAETLLGSVNQPYPLHIGESTGIQDALTGWDVRVEENSLYLSLDGKTIDRVTLTDVYGNVVLAASKVVEGEAINISALQDGVYIVTAEQAGAMYYKKIMKVGK